MLLSGDVSRRLRQSVRGGQISVSPSGDDAVFVAKLFVAIAHGSAVIPARDIPRRIRLALEVSS